MSTMVQIRRSDKNTGQPVEVCAPFAITRGRVQGRFEITGELVTRE